MRSAGRWIAACALALSASGCALSPPSPAWQPIRGLPRHAVVLAAARTRAGTAYIYLDAQGRQALLSASGRRVALGNAAGAVQSLAWAPLAVYGGRLYAASGRGLLPYRGGGRFSAPLQIPGGTAPVAMTPCRFGLCFSEIATTPRGSGAAVGQAALLALRGRHLSRLPLPRSFRPLPEPMLSTGSSLYVLAAPEPETLFALLGYGLRGRPRILARFPRWLRPLASCAGPGGPLVLLRGRGHLWLFSRRGTAEVTGIPRAAVAATAVAPPSLAAAPHAACDLGLPGLPGRRGTPATLWRLAPTGKAVRLPLPGAARRLSPAPLLLGEGARVLAVFSGRTAYLP